jgi:hypothetical protein
MGTRIDGLSEDEAARKGVESVPKLLEAIGIPGRDSMKRFIENAI